LGIAAEDTLSVVVVYRTKSELLGTPGMHLSQELGYGFGYEGEVLQEGLGLGLSGYRKA
jgi:hypothetical protein